MPSSRRERSITVSGKNGYVQLLPEEQKALRIEVYFTATNVGETNYYSYEWYKERTLYGRFKIAHGEYTSKEKLCQYQNELLYSEESTLFEVVKRIQCGLQKQYEVNKFLVEGLIQLASASSIPLGFGAGGTAFDQIPPQPIEIPGLQIDGIYYNMFPGCAGNLIFQTWYDDDICKDVNGNPLTKDNRGKAPEPASAGRPPAGNDTNVPPPTTAPDSSYVDPTPGSDIPTDVIANPGRPNGISSSLYTITFRVRYTDDGSYGSNSSLTILGQYGGLRTVLSDGGRSAEFSIQTAIGVPTVSQPRYTILLSSTGVTNGVPNAVVEILSIVPQ